ncbi:NAD(P)-binding domain-containing protein [Micromonospora echinospora]|uniref:NAD(P)-binding domain-containing protein n=1 Tax=Micromonospora echinospora TaxID=1877 RepID=UPI00344A130C
MATIAIVGFGDMGEQMAPHLLAAGHQVRVSDISDSRLETARACVEVGARA